MTVLRLLGPFLLFAALSWSQCSKLVFNPLTSALDCIGNTGGGTISSPVNAQTGTTYTFLNSDLGKLVTGANVSAQAYMLPQANGSTFISGWYVDVQNRGAGTMTITPTTSTIDGAATLVLYATQGARIFSNGTNYFTQKGAVDPSATLTVTSLTATGSGAGTIRVCDSTDTYCVGLKGSAARTTSLDVVVPTADPTANQFRVCTAASGGSCTESWLSMPLTTKGDLWVTGTGGSMGRLPVGTDTYALVADSTQTYGVKWAAAGGGISYIERSIRFAGGAGSSAVALVGYTNFGAACPTDATMYSSTGSICYLYGYDAGTEHNAVMVSDQIPSGWTSGAITFTLWFGGATAGGNTIQMKAETACVATTESVTPASFNSPQNFASQASAAGKIYSSTITLTTTGCAASELLYVRMTRVDTSGYAAWYGGNIKYVIP